MHCRPSSHTNDSTCSTSYYSHSDYSNTINHQNCSALSYHDQMPSPLSTTIPPPLPPRRRQRLEDLVISYSSNYYATYPCQASPLSSESSESPSSHSSRRIYQQSEDNVVYCDLFNLLELPLPSSPPVKSRKKYTLADHHPRRRHPSVTFRNTHGKMKDINERKRHHQTPPSSSYKKEKKHEDESSSTHQYDRLKENTKTNDCIYQQHSTSKGFFRRVARNYFCMPMTIANAEFSN